MSWHQAWDISNQPLLSFQRAVLSQLSCTQRVCETFWDFNIRKWPLNFSQKIAWHCFTTCRHRFAWQAQYFSVLHLTLHTPHFTLHFTLHPLHCTRYTPHCTLHTLHFRLHTLHFTLHTPHSTLHTLHSTLHTLHFRFHTLHFALYTPHFTLYTLHFTPHTLHITLCGLLARTLCLPGLFPGIWCVSQFLFGVCRSGGGTSFPL